MRDQDVRTTITLGVDCALQWMSAARWHPGVGLVHFNSMNIGREAARKRLAGDFRRARATPEGKHRGHRLNLRDDKWDARH
jgi:hypothetical protein